MLDAARLHPQRVASDEFARLRYVITQIRSLPGWRVMPIVLIPEDGPPGAGENLFHAVRDMTPIICMTECGNSAYGANRFGVRKDADTTMRMKDKLLLAMQHDPSINGIQLGLSTELFSLQHHAKGNDVATTLDTLSKQMKMYRVLIKKAYSENANDDLLIAVMLLVSYSDMFIRQRNAGRPSYVEFHRLYLRGSSR